MIRFVIVRAVYALFALAWVIAQVRGADLILSTLGLVMGLLFTCSVVKEVVFKGTITTRQDGTVSFKQSPVRFVFLCMIFGAMLVMIFCYMLLGWKGEQS